MFIFNLIFWVSSVLGFCRISVWQIEDSVNITIFIKPVYDSFCHWTGARVWCCSEWYDAIQTNKIRKRNLVLYTSSVNKQKVSLYVVTYTSTSSIFAPPSKGVPTKTKLSEPTVTHLSSGVPVSVVDRIIEQVIESFTQRIVEWMMSLVTTYGCNVVMERRSVNHKTEGLEYTVKICGIFVLFFFHDCTEYWNKRFFF